MDSETTIVEVLWDDIYVNGGGYHMPAGDYGLSGGSAILIDIRMGGSRSFHKY